MADPPRNKRERSSSSPSFPAHRQQGHGPPTHHPASPTSSQHVPPTTLKFLDAYRDRGASLTTSYQQSLYWDYWMQPNGAVTDGVLHLAYNPDWPPGTGPPKHPDLVRAEYERISASIDWMAGERGAYGAALVVYGQPGCGKSRFLCVERGRLFERGKPCIVTTTERTTFDLYCDAGAFFDIPLAELAALGLLVPTVALVDAAEGADGSSTLQHAFVNDFIRNVVVVFATSPRIRRWNKLSTRLVPTLYWTIEGWPDNELDALERIISLVPPSHWTTSPRVRLQRAEESPPTHLPPLKDVIGHSTPDDLQRLQQKLAITPAKAGLPRSPPSTFLPSLPDPYYRLPDGLSSTTNTLYSFREAVYLLGRTVRAPLGAVDRSQQHKSRPPQCLLEDLFDGLPRFNAVFTSLAHVTSLSGLPDTPEPDVSAIDELTKLAKEMGIKEDDQDIGFHQLFAEIPTPGVPRPTRKYPSSIIIPASAPLEELTRRKLDEASLADLARHARSFIHHPIVHGIAHEVYAARVIELAGATVVLVDETTFSLPRLPRTVVHLPLVKTAADVDEDPAKVATAIAQFDYRRLAQLEPRFPTDVSSSSSALSPGLYLPQTGFPALDAVAIYYEDDGQLVVVALQMTVSNRHDVKLSGIQSLYQGLGRHANKAKLHFAFVVPSPDKGKDLLKPSRPTLPPAPSISRPRRSNTRSSATNPFTWLRGYIVIDPKTAPAQ